MTSRVYVIGDPSTDGPVKIGTTGNLTARLAAIKGGRGAIVPAGVDLAAVEVLHDYPGDRRLEVDLHRHYAKHRLVGEWFDLTQDEAQHILFCYLEAQGAVETVIRRGTGCGCLRCQLQHQPGQRPGDRPELVNPSIPFLAALNAITHARLGIHVRDDHVALPASHCDIDRAARLLAALEHHSARPR